MYVDYMMRPVTFCDDQSITTTAIRIYLYNTCTTSLTNLAFRKR